MTDFIYTLNYIENRIQDISNQKLNEDVYNYLNNLLNDISLPQFNILPNFENNRNEKNDRTKYKSFKNFNRLKNKNKNYSNNNNNSVINSSINSPSNNISNNISNKNSDNINNCNINFDNKTCNINHGSIDEINYNVNRIKIINEQSQYSTYTNNIRKILNKITQNNFSKLKNEFICYYNIILKDIAIEDISNTNNNIETVNNFIFDTLAYTNTIVSNLYCDILLNLININYDFYIILNVNLDKLLDICSYITTPKSINYDDINLSNKNNDKLKTFCIFLINCFKSLIIPSDILFKSILLTQTELLTKYDNENNKSNQLNESNNNDYKAYCEVVNEINHILISNSYCLICSKEYEKDYNNIYLNIEKIIGLKNKTKNLTNKIIFKQMDLYEKYKPNY